jgi:hypothetical protein
MFFSTTISLPVIEAPSSSQKLHLCSNLSVRGVAKFLNIANDLPTEYYRKVREEPAEDSRNHAKDTGTPFSTS